MSTRLCTLIAVAILALALPPLVARAQLTIPGLETPSKPSETAPAGPAAEGSSGKAIVPIAPAAIAVRARETQAQLEATRRGLGDASVRTIAEGLARLSEERAHLNNAASAVSARSRRDDLADLLIRWDTLHEQLREWQNVLARRTESMTRQGQTLDNLALTWTRTEEALRSRDDVPAAALAKTEQIANDVRATQELVNASASQLLSLQDQLDASQDILEEDGERVHGAQAEQIAHVLDVDGLIIWQLFDPALYPEQRLPALRIHSARLREGLLAFWDRYRHGLFLDVIAALLLLIGTLVLAKRTRERADEAGAAGAAALEVLRAPVGSALLLILVAARFAYPRAMFSVLELVTLVSLIPLAHATPQLVRSPALIPSIYLAIFALAFHRAALLLHVEAPWHEASMMIAAGLLLSASLWGLRSMSSADSVRAAGAERVALRANRLYLQASVVGLSLSLLFGLLGYHALLSFVLFGFMGTTYWWMIGLAIARVLSAFFEAFLASQRVRGLSSVRAHEAMMRARALWLARVVSIGLWLVGALYSFSALVPLVSLIRGVLSATMQIGSWAVSLGDVVSFVLTMYLASKLSSLVSFALETDVLPRMNLGRGVPATISRLAGYAIITMGFVFAVGAAGVDMSRVALLASALSVGIGFGLQNVVNNFVSGLILIFERPIRVGDTVQVEELLGDVRSIGIRASTLRTAQGAEVIVPNGDLISSRVINWTLTDLSRRIEVPVGVAYGSDPAQVQSLIIAAARSLSDMVEYPPPQCLFTGFGESSLDFELRMWIRRADDWPNVRSAALVAIHDKLKEAGIEIPFPQRDLNLRSIDETATRELAARVPPSADE